MKNLINLKLLIYTLLLLLLVLCTDDDPIEYRLTTVCTPDKTGAVTPASGMFNEGTEVELKATPIDEYIFKNWTGDASGNDNPLKVIMLDDKNITAVFEKVDYALTLDVIGEGTVNQEIVLAKSSSTDYESGTTVQLTAVPDTEWKFVEWSGDHTGTENPIQLKMDQAMTITAKFEKVSYSLAIEINGNGTIDEAIIQAKSASKDYESGTTVQLTAVPEDQWEFVGWSGDYTGAENPIQITIDKPMSIVATFEVENLEKTYVPDDNFEKALIDLGYDEVLDDYVFNYKINKVKSLTIDSRQIEDLTGIEGFESLEDLIVSDNSLVSLDISNNLDLKFLNCSNNQIVSLDISLNLNLTWLNVDDNPMDCVKVNRDQLPYFSSLYQTPAVLFALNCDSANEEKTFVPDDNFEQALIDLGFDDVLDDYVKTFDITYLKSLNISGRNISDLTGLEDFISLITLNAHNNNISLVDPFLGSTFTRLFTAGTIILSDNNISSLDISGIYCLTLLDVRNNPLTCIQINEYQQSCIEGTSLIIMQVKTDEGVTTSLDCGN